MCKLITIQLDFSRKEDTCWTENYSWINLVDTLLNIMFLIRLLFYLIETLDETLASAVIDEFY